MRKSTYIHLAEHFVNALGVSSGENIWINSSGYYSQPLAKVCKGVILSKGANPYIFNVRSRMRDFLGLHEKNSDPEIVSSDLEALQKVDKSLFITEPRDYNYTTEQFDHPNYDRSYRHGIKVHSHLLDNTSWMSVSPPTAVFARVCNMPRPEFERYYLRACLQDYSKMREAAKPLQKILAQGKKVRILGDETDLSFSIEGIAAEICSGQFNIPDGECFTAPVRNTVNGAIKFGRSILWDDTFDFIKLTFADGRAIKAEAESEDSTNRINEILDDYEGIRYTGEFAIAFNPLITDPAGIPLFDEKINGSIHLALGYCHGVAGNGNEAELHWDLVQIQRPEHGGGEIYIDDRLIRKDGIFVVPELVQLNPENLITGCSLISGPDLN
jgi:aminopeptidase